MVASATLAILLVCFSIYQYSQLDPSAKTAVARPRLPTPPTQSAEFSASAGSKGVRVGLMADATSRGPYSRRRVSGRS